MSKIEHKQIADLQHPMQPIGMLENALRFKSNPLIKHLLDQYPLGLNGLRVHCNGYSDEDYSQLMQLIGYSVSGFQNLPTTPVGLIEQVQAVVDNPTIDEKDAIIAAQKIVMDVRLERLRNIY